MNSKTEERLEREAEVRRAKQESAQNADTDRATNIVNIERQEGDKTRKRTCNRADLAHFQAQGYKVPGKGGSQKSG